MALLTFILINMKIKDIYLYIATVLAIIFAFGSFTYAQIGGGIANPNFFKKSGSAILPIDPNATIGNEISPFLAGYFTTLNASSSEIDTLVISSAHSGNLDINAGNVILDNGKQITFSDGNWAIGRNIVADTGGTVTSNSLQIRTFNNIAEGFQLVVGTTPYFEVRSDTGNVRITGGATITGDVVPSVDGTYDLGIQTNNQWANLWADLVNGSDYAYLNSWRTLESEKYDGYPEGIAFANDCFETGKIQEKMPSECKPIFVVTEEFIEFQGIRLNLKDIERIYGNR